MGVVKHGIKLPREVVELPSWRILKTQLDKDLSDLLYLILLSAGGLDNELQKFLPTSTIL